RQCRLPGAAELTAARVEKVPINRLAFRWALDPDWARLTDVGASFAGGALLGAAAVPLRGTTPGAASFTLRQVALKEIARNIPTLQSVPAEGRVAGAFAARPPVARARLTAARPLVTERMQVRGITAERASVSAVFNRAGVGYRLVGRTLGGTVSLTGSLPLGGAVRTVAATELPPGELRIDGIRLERLAESLGVFQQPSPIAGTANLSLDYHHDPADGWPMSSGRIRLAQVRWGDRELAPVVQADLALTRDQVQVKEAVATLLQGRFRGHAIL